ncbi:tripartite tricarboxylate transporter substrate binding protein [Orrella sp. JC864]|uniref:Bug family tripartite tricarboxylate transporter substrate binding protein n=1 Tax=Orrella sp. JC864 TaxID=3120298 RepID=UPI00300AF436
MTFAHRIRLALACLAAMAAGAAPAAPQAYPERPLTLVVPYPAGGVADQIARPIAQALGQRLGQPVVIENRAGANGNIGSVYVARQQPADGYTLLLGSLSTLAINPHLYKSMGYDPLQDLQPVSLTHQMPNVLVVGPRTPYRSVADVVAAAKADPGGLVYGSAGNGNTMHLTGVQFQQQSGTQLLHVPYKGGPPALNDVMAGQIPMMFNNLPAVVAFHRAGRVRVLAVAADQRSPLLPDVPTMAEAGVPGVVTTVWNGLLVRQGTPPAIVQRLNAELRAVLQDPAFQAPLQALGYEVLWSTPEAMQTLIRTDSEAMAQTIEQADIRID